MTKLVSTNPADNYSKLGEVDISSDKDISSRVSKANKVKNLWKELGVKKRVKLLEPIRDEFVKRKEEIAKLISIETGKVISESLSEVSRYIDELTWFLENGPKALKDEINLNDEKSLHRI